MSDNSRTNHDSNHAISLNGTYQIPPSQWLKQPDAKTLPDGSYTNPCVQTDEQDNYHNPRIGCNSASFNCKYVETRGPKDIGHGLTEQIPPENDTADYSLRSYVKDWPIYRKVEHQFGSLFQKCSDGQWVKKILLSLMAMSYVVYFIAVLLIYSKDMEGEKYWCSGDGFLIIINVIVIIFLSYYQLYKPLVGKKAHKGLMTLKKFSDDKIGWIGRAVKICFFLAVVIFYAVDSASDRARLVSLFGIFVLIAFGFIFSTAPRKVIWSQVIWGLVLQFLFGLAILRWSVGRAVFSCLGDKVNEFLKFTDSGSEFVYGKIVTELEVFAFKNLGLETQKQGSLKLGWLLQMSIGTTACESVTAAANIFLGQCESPLLIKPFLPKMTKSELHAVITSGFATIGGAVFAAYISFGVEATHILSASVMSAPAALGFSKLFYPELEVSKTRAEDIKIEKGKESNVLHAACEGVVLAIPIVANIIANLLAFIAFIAFVDAILNWSCLLINIEEGVCSLSNLFGYVFMPLAWVMGVPWQDCYIVGQMIGTKTIINEFVAYLELVHFVKKGMITKRSEVIATYALCGCSNISSIGIQLGASGALMPERRGDLAQIAVRAMVAGSIACFLTACVAGSLINVDEGMVNSREFSNVTEAIEDIL